MARQRELVAEGFDRNGHWTRELSLCGEGWSVLEHWAGEFGFGLIHLKGKRRIYRKGDNPGHYVTFVEFRLEEESNHLHISAWIEAGTFPRLLSGFSIPSVVGISPSGFWAIRVRREACHALNSLLTRMKQPMILGSNGWHWADLDLSTVTLGFLTMVTLLLFGLASARLIEIEPGLSTSLLKVVGNNLGYIAGTFLLLIFAHQFYTLKKFAGPTKWISAFGAYVIILVTTISLFTHSSSESQLLQMTYHCIQRLDSERCGEFLDGLSPNARQVFVERIFALEDELTRRELGKKINQQY